MKDGRMNTLMFLAMTTALGGLIGFMAGVVMIIMMFVSETFGM